MIASNLTLLIPEKNDLERDAVAQAWINADGEVIRLGRFWEPPNLENKQVRVYGNNTFCLVLQQKLGFDLISPSDTLIFDVPPQYLKRKIKKFTLSESTEIQFPIFIKSLVPKLIQSKVYDSLSKFHEACLGLSRDTEFIASEIIDFISEFRSFILNGQLLDCAVYEGNGNVEAAISFIDNMIQEIQIPSVIVIDIGLSAEGFSLIEFNASWGAGLNGCQASKILPAIIAASGK